MDKIILLVNDAPELTEQFIQLGEVFGYTHSDIHVIQHIETTLEKNQFNKMMLNYSGCTTCSNDLETVINAQPSGSTVLIIDDDYFFKTTGVTDYLSTQLISHVDGVGLIEDSEIKVLYIQKENFVYEDYSAVYNPSDLMDYFENQKVINASRG